MIRKALFVAVVLAPCSSVWATGVQAVAPIQGYTCMQLARDAAHLNDPNTLPVMRSSPSAGGSSLGFAPFVVIARTPRRVVNGYVEVLWLGSTRDHPVTGWVPEGELLPYRSALAPGASCTPAWLSNGRAGVMAK